MFVTEPSRQERLLKYALIALGSTLVLVFFFAVSKINRSIPAPDSGQIGSNQEKKDDVQKVMTEKLSGTVVAVDTENFFIRVSVEGGKIYSISVPETAEITWNGAPAKLGDIPPLAKATLQATALSDTESYDYVASSLDILEKEKTLEEKMDQMRQFKPVNN